MKKLVTCGALGLATVLAIYAVGALPGAWEESFVEALLMPGGLAWAWAWPEGIESDGGEYWILASIATDIALYAAAWALALSVVSRLKRR